MAKVIEKKAPSKETSKYGYTGEKLGFAFGKENYILLFVGLIVLFAGYLLLIGGGSEDPTVFTGEELFNTRRMVIAPLALLAGFIIEIVAIMKRPRK